MIDNKNNKEEEMFKVPENYFEDFTDNVINSLDKNEIKRKSIFSLIRPHLMLAASMVFIVVVSYSSLRLLLPEMGNDTQLDIQGDITEYLAYELDQTTIFESLEQIEFDTTSELINTISISDEEIIDYLIDENIMYDEIIENL